VRHRGNHQSKKRRYVYINVFWGEIYLVTQEGYERLHRTGDELLAV
jgi:hypothetical protein